MNIPILGQPKGAGEFYMGGICAKCGLPIFVYILRKTAGSAEERFYAPCGCDVEQGTELTYPDKPDAVAMQRAIHIALGLVYRFKTMWAETLAGPPTDVEGVVIIGGDEGEPDTTSLSS